MAKGSRAYNCNGLEHLPNDAHRDSSGKFKYEAKLSPCSVVLCHASREEYLYVRAHAWFVLWYKK